MTSRIWLVMCVVALATGLIADIDMSLPALVCVATSSILRRLED